jgi:hypothetical protein
VAFSITKENTMSIRMENMGLVVGGALLLSNAGCVVVGVGDWGWGSCGTAVWTEPTTDRLSIDPAGLKAVKARTHNGAISLASQADTSEAYVIVTKKAGGRTQADAEAALAALEVYVEDSGPGTKLIGWRWTGEKKRNWGARVNYEIKAPSNVHFEGETHNGPIEVDGIAGEVKVVSHNGEINVRSTGEKLYAETHNGEVEVAYAGNDITVITHNGEVVADLGGCKAVSGSIATHNGGIELVLGDGTSTKLECQTHNGVIDCDTPLTRREISRRTLTGTVGTGDGNLAVTTYNGTVRIKRTIG